MKKIQILLLCIFANIFSVAQVAIVPEVGFNIANAAFTNNNWANRKALIGFTGGVGLNYNLSADGFLSLQPSLLYSQKGFTARSNNSAIDYDGFYRLDYIELPVLFRITFGEDLFKAHINAGPSIGYLLNGRVKGKGTALGIFQGNIDNQINFTDNVINPISDLDANLLEVGINFGGDIIYAIGNRTALFINVRYNIGLTDFDRNQSSKNRVFACTAGIQIPLPGS